jgi:putative heme-binding domain-containing protein
LTAILDPNRAIDANYFSYTVVTTSGQIVNGMIAAETASAVSLKQPENKTVTVLRDQIEDLKSDRISLMPVGFEKKIDVQQMADLIAFIKNWRYLNTDAVPESIVPAAGGR